MASNELVDARIAESIAQRAYELAAHILTAVVAVIAIASPIMIGSFLYSTDRLGEERSTAAALAQSAQERADTFVKECLSATSKLLIDYYCGQRDQMQQLAIDTNKNFSRAIRSSSNTTVDVAFWLILLLGVSSTASAVTYMRGKSHALTTAQTKRMRLEAKAEASKPTPRPSRRIAGHAR